MQLLENIEEVRERRNRLFVVGCLLYFGSSSRLGNWKGGTSFMPRSGCREPGLPYSWQSSSPSELELLVSQPTISITGGLSRLRI